MGKRGPRPWKPTPEDIAKIRLYSGLGSTLDQVAALVGKSPDTLQRNPVIREVLAAGRAETITRVAGKLVEQALKGNMTAAISGA